MNTLKINFPLEPGEVIAMLQHYKISPTRQRVKIAEYLFQRPQHLSAEKILQGVTDAGNRVSRSTVYNTMGLFANKGVVREVLIDRERVFYDSNPDIHQHLYNIDTGELTDVYDTEVSTMSQPGLLEGLRIVSTDVIYKVTSREPLNNKLT
jgi:Fur family iron response transcriptional regulator